MFISKHHYAIELAKLGNKVYFLNCPDQRNELRPGQIKIIDTEYPNLHVIDHRFFFPFIIRYKGGQLFYKLVTIHIRRILKKLKEEIDIVWSFDNSDAIPLRCFPESATRIFMPVDELSAEKWIVAAKGADMIASVTDEILEKYSAYNIPKLFLNHGVSSIFINHNIHEGTNTPIQVGLSGNFLRPDVDRITLLKIIEAHPDIIFNFWGAVNYVNANIAAEGDQEAISFTNKLSSLPNVKAHGVVNVETLSSKLKEVDCFLICYDIQKDQSKGTNYHKILEYLAAGKVTISNNVTTYQKYPGLLVMPQTRENNDELPALFENVVKNLNKFNSIDEQQKRVDFANNYLYVKQIEKIATFLTNTYKT